MATYAPPLIVLPADVEFGKYHIINACPLPLQCAKLVILLTFIIFIQLTTRRVTMRDRSETATVPLVRQRRTRNASPEREQYEMLPEVVDPLQPTPQVDPLQPSTSWQPTRRP
ncbi:uncharacterized protein LOC114358716 isoform X1 [Ostrinia furnacalis]|uniref:uncharacterized protein LOC114358716 isoform X1 n=1 Tax=Ostrinia furnacalis TaxID=93504 RepID=UPI00103F9A4F|nr:uncharacterized protein LOC114358716 isoform X1 [Ostrinia furnacalis]